MLLDKITIVVDDYDRAIEFFTDILGFDLAGSGRRSLTAQAG